MSDLGATTSTIASSEDEKIPKRFHSSCRMMSSEEPDVTIVVGGKEFREYRQILRCVSGYFDAAMRSGMKESESMRFEFPDKNPDDWELFASLIAPCSTARITENNVETVLEWCDELCVVPSLMARCDDTYSELMMSRLAALGEDNDPSESGVEEYRQIQSCLVDTMLQGLERGLACNLALTKQAMFLSLKMCFGKFPEGLQIESISRIIAMLSESQECRDTLWNTFRQFIPEALLEHMERDQLLSNEMLPYTIKVNIEKITLTKDKTEVYRYIQTLPSKLKSKLQAELAYGQARTKLSPSFCQTKLRELIYEESPSFYAMLPDHIKYT